MTNPNPRAAARRAQLDHDPVELRRRRVMAGREQTDVAAEAGIGQSYLSELERGTRNPSPPVLARLAEVLGCNTEDLMPARPTAGRVA